jgi:hypothetical protein
MYMKQLSPIPLLIVLSLGLAACTAVPAGSPGNPTVAGATGRTVVPGSNSTVAGDAEATDLQRKWPLVPAR